MRRLALPAAVALAALGAWLSLGSLAVATPDGPRIALLPISPGALIAIAAVGAAVAAFARARASLTPVCLLILVVLPWLPLPMPAAVLIWAGSIRWLVWTAVALLLVVSVLRQRSGPIWPASIANQLRNTPQMSAGVLAFAMFSASAWLVSPSVPGGDEPHYLVIAQSLLLDRDLKIENNHRRADYQSYFAGTLPPHYIARGRDGEIYSIHAPGLAVAVAPAFAVGGYPAVVVFLLILAACGSALAWHVAWLATKSTSGAWFGWAAVTASATAVFHSFTVYPDGLGGVIALTGAWALLRAAREEASGSVRVLPWLLHGAALATLPWLHSRFSLLAGTLGALVLLRLSKTKNPLGKAVAFLSIPAVSALCWIGYFLVIYGVPDPSAPYGTTRDFSLAFVPGGLTGLLFDQRFGLIANAPVLVCALGGFWLMVRPGSHDDVSPQSGGYRRLALELLFVVGSYLVTATSYAMWWAGWSAPARFANPAVFMLAIPCAVAWTVMRHRATKIIAAGALVLTVFLSFVLVTTDGGRLAYNTRETTALWLDWSSRLTAMGDGMPAWFRGREAVYARDVALWAALLLLAWRVAIRLGAHPRLADGVRFATIVAATYAGAVMTALTLTWWLHGVDGVTAAPAQLEFLQRLASDPRALTFNLSPPRRLPAGEVLGLMRIESAPRQAGAGGGMGRNEQPLIALPAVPAGRYRVLTRTRGPGGWLLLGIGQDQFAIRSEPLAWPPRPLDVDLPVAVRALVVRGDEDARRAVRSVVIEPVQLRPVDARATEAVARRAVKYGTSTVFFLDERSFPEPDAFWVGGSRQASFVVQSDRAQASIPFQLRNAPVDNRVVVESGQWKEELTLAPGEERIVAVPVTPGRSDALISITSASGFRPSDADPTSRDQRFLGVWVKIGSE